MEKISVVSFSTKFDNAAVFIVRVLSEILLFYIKILDIGLKVCDIVHPTML